MARSTKGLKLNIPKIETPDPTLGGGSWPLQLDTVENHAWQAGLFNEAELDAIIQLGNNSEVVKASTFGTQSDKYRNSYVSFFFPNGHTDWIFKRLTAGLIDINKQFFNFDLTGMEQGLQFTRYTAPGQHYHWHVDRGHMIATRKLSLVVQLSDPKDYKGGELQLKFGKEDTTISKQRGLITYFPSYTLHRVKPVTQGTRYSLVAWISGPPFK